MEVSLSINFFTPWLELLTYLVIQEILQLKFEAQKVTLGGPVKTKNVICSEKETKISAGSPTL